MQVVALQKICGILKETPSFFHAHASNNELHPPPSCPRDFCIPWLSRATARDEVGFYQRVWFIPLDQVAVSRIFCFTAQNVSRKFSPSEIMATITLFASCQLLDLLHGIEGIQGLFAAPQM